MPQPNTTPNPDVLGSASQRRLLADLAAELNLTVTGYDSVEALREAIDRLIAVKLSRRTGRPLPSLDDPVAVRKAAERMTALVSGSPRGPGRYTTRHVEPKAPQRHTARSLLERRYSLDRVELAAYAAGFEQDTAVSWDSGRPEAHYTAMPATTATTKQLTYLNDLQRKAHKAGFDESVTTPDSSREASREITRLRALLNR